MHRERIRDRFPILNAYGTRHEFLDTESAIGATTEDRIRSIWPFLVRRVLAFQATLKSRERVNFDPEDTLSELWCVLAAKDKDWTPERGKYITFAGVVIDRELSAIRDKSHTVESPRNSSGRLREYEAEVEDGSISVQRMHTCKDIRRTSEGIQALMPGAGNRPGERGSIGRDPAAILAEEEEDARMLKDIRIAVSKLPAFEAHVLGRLGGLWGRPPESTWEVAMILDRDVNEIRKVQSRATDKVKQMLMSIRPAATSR